MSWRRTAAAALGLLLAAAAVQAAAAPDLGLPAPAWQPAPHAQVALGRKLFFDRRLSFNGTLSCAMCHVPEQGFASTASRTALGMEGRLLRRNAPTLLNVGWLPRLFHDGRENSLRTQVWSPLLEPTEMANPSAGYLLEKLRALPDYSGRFEAAFGGREADMTTLGAALEAFERSLVAAGSPFDRWRYGGDAGALSAAQQAGYALFVGKARCAACHLVGSQSALFTDSRYHATGVAQRPAQDRQVVTLAPGTTTGVTQVELAAFASVRPPDLGRFEISLDPADRFAFRTPSLRNVERTPPYMHDGSLPTLEAVVDFYDGGGGNVPNKSALIAPLHLSDEEKANLVGFLKSLTSPAVDTLPAAVRAGNE